MSNRTDRYKFVTIILCLVILGFVPIIWRQNLTAERAIEIARDYKALCSEDTGDET